MIGRCEIFDIPGSLERTKTWLVPQRARRSAGGFIPSATKPACERSVVGMTLSIPQRGLDTGLGAGVIYSLAFRSVPWRGSDRGMGRLTPSGTRLSGPWRSVCGMTRSEPQRGPVAGRGGEGGMYALAFCSVPQRCSRCGAGGFFPSSGKLFNGW